eukprot:scaffold139314_cov172-Phaeocystis_antarctica.AAC.1
MPRAPSCMLWLRASTPRTRRGASYTIQQADVEVGVWGRRKMVGLRVAMEVYLCMVRGAADL